MSSGAWIAIYLPMFIFLFVILPANANKVKLIRQLKKRRGEKTMSNAMIENLIGKEVLITTGSLGSSYNKVTVVEVVDNWVRVEKKGKEDLINIDFVQSIKILEG